MLSGVFLRFSPLSLILRAIPPLKGLVDQYDIISELLDAVPWDIVVLSSAEQAEEAAGAEYDDGFHRALRQTDLQIAHIAQLTAVAEIDDLLASQLAKSHKHISHLRASICNLQAVPFRRFRTLFAARNNPRRRRKYWMQTRDGGALMRGKVEICGINTADLKVLKNDEMMALLKRSRNGDQYAREQLICGNLRLVLSVIQRFLGRGENVDDLFQVGCIGLIKAIDRFDINQDVRFSTYGVPMIYGRRKNYFSKVLKICRNT